MEKPKFVTEEHLSFLDGLRASGACNMFGSPQYLQEVFSMSRTKAKETFFYWMESFAERQGLE